MISLKAVRSPDEGDYTCEATNIARDADGNVIVVKKSVRLSVKCEYVYLVYSPLSHPIRYIYIYNGLYETVFSRHDVRPSQLASRQKCARAPDIF